MNNRFQISEKLMPMHDLYTIQKGEICVMGKIQSGGMPIMELLKGDVFGNIPFLDLGHEPKGASLLASKDLVAHKLDIKMLQEEYNRLSETFKNIIENAGTSISVTTKMLYDLKNARQYYGINKPH